MERLKLIHQFKFIIINENKKGIADKQDSASSLEKKIMQKPPE